MSTIFSHFKDGWRQLDPEQQKAHYLKLSKSELVDQLVHMTEKYFNEAVVGEKLQREINEKHAQVTRLITVDDRQRRVIIQLAQTIVECNK